MLVPSQPANVAVATSINKCWCQVNHVMVATSIINKRWHQVDESSIQSQGLGLEDRILHLQLPIVY